MVRTCFVVVANGVADGPVGITLDVLGAATRIRRAGLDTSGGKGELVPKLVSLDGQPVRTAAKRGLEVDGSLRDARPGKRDVVLVPGLGMASEPEIERTLANDSAVELAARLAKLAPRVAAIGASCSATFLLAASGALDGHSATTTWWLAPVFARRFPNVELRQDRMVVASGNRMTAGSAFAHADLVLALVAKLAGPTLAHLVASYLVLDERTSQARYMVRSHVRTNDPMLGAVEKYVLANLASSVELADLARVARTSPRTLARRVSAAFGTTPLRYVQRLKMDRAAHLLESSRDSVDAIAERVGYADASAFRRVFRREMGRSPRELRET